MRTRSKSSRWRAIRRRHQANPSAAIVLPVVVRVVPALAVGGEVVGRAPGHRDRPARPRRARRGRAMAHTSALSRETKIGRSPKSSTPRRCGVLAQRGPLHGEDPLLEAQRAATRSASGRQQPARTALGVAVAQRRLPGQPRVRGRAASRSATNSTYCSSQSCVLARPQVEVVEPLGVGVGAALPGVGRALPRLGARQGAGGHLGELVVAEQALVAQHLDADQLGVAGHRRDRVVRRRLAVVGRHQRQHLPHACSRPRRGSRRTRTPPGRRRRDRTSRAGR